MNQNSSLAYVQYAAAAAIALCTPAGLSAQRSYPTYSLPSAMPAPSGAPIAVFRGRMGGDVPSWVEIADLGEGRYVLSILDGIPGIADNPQQLLLTSNGKKGSGCLLTNGTAVKIEGCPKDKAQAVKIAFGKLKGNVQMQPVGIAGAYGYTGQNIGVSGINQLQNIASACRFSTLTRSDGLAGEDTHAAIKALTNAIQQAQAQTPAAATKLPALRAQRAQQFTALYYNSWELDRLNGFDRDSSRIIDFRYQMRIAEQKRQYQAQIDMTPARVAARQRLAQIESELAALYAPARVQGQADPVAAIRTAEYVDKIDLELSLDLANSPEPSLDSLLIVERGLREVQACDAALGRTPLHTLSPAKAALDAQFSRIASGFRTILGDEIESGLSSAALKTRLAAYRGSPGLMNALKSAGQIETLNLGDARVAALAQYETDQRNAKILADQREKAQIASAAAAKEQARLSFSKSGAKAPTDGDILQSYLYYLKLLTWQDRGIYGVREIPGDKFQLGARGRYAGDLFRVRFDIAQKSCTALGKQTYRCSFTVVNQFSNARDGSIESWANGLSDSIWGLLSGRNNEGLTGRIQSASINGLLINDRNDFTATFKFQNGWYQSIELKEAVTIGTLTRLR
jgi:hypothetical protein